MRSEKIAIVAEIRSQVKNAAFVLLANHRGMKVSQLKDLRKRLAKKKAELHVVKNSFLQKACDDLPGMKINEPLVVPLAIVFGPGDGIEAAKILDDFKKETNTAALEGGFLSARRFSAAEFSELIKLPSRHALLGMLVGGLAAPLSGLVGVMQQKVASVVYVLQAIRELKSKSGSK